MIDKKLYDYLLAQGIDARVFNKENNTITVSITSAECLALLKGLNYQGAKIQAVLVGNCIFKLEDVR